MTFFLFLSVLSKGDPLKFSLLQYPLAPWFIILFLACSISCRERFKKAMAKLPEKHREIPDLVFFNDLTSPEVSWTLGTTGPWLTGHFCPAP